ncbi:ABC transporter ATP-binding protein [Paenibacillus sp. SC116]|uniref:ABC transporter ATP-binding protein n=1 Tax=Paenibacillus sp. SC116 TaxID=2968986 RepID=UPI00215AE6AA|nr:ABC transporter ATP-binding protein [Paenibacillus sp. SC116]MCR8844849.1 ABC transporter ATP-binding protein [Paenibacillus sp. SC116]
MYSSYSVEISNISKSFTMYEKPIDRLKQIFLKKKNFSKQFWALENISLNIAKGTTIGLIGKNGSGKSTLLQLIAGTLTPTGGEIKIDGRIAALLELGSGFNPEFTGRENIYLNGAIMGLSDEEMNQRVPEIERFADIGEFIDQPVKSYSSGMFVRLAFACAVNVDPDILIVDEALAVGDMQFQLKCIEKMKSFKNEGKTIIFVSHDTYSIRNFCDEVIWIMDGRIHMRGEVNEVSRLYEDYMKNMVDVPVAATNDEEVNVEVDLSKQTLSINEVSFYDNGNKKINRFELKDDIIVEVQYTLHQKIENLVGGIAIFDRENNYICGLNTKLDQYQLPTQPGEYKIKLKYNNVSLLPGTYYIDVGFFESSGLIRLDYKARYSSFLMSSSSYIAEGLTYIDHSWHVVEGE